MSFPNEQQVARAITAKYAGQLGAMNRLHGAVLGMLAADSWTFTKRGLDPVVAHTMIGLLTKASKTFRSVQLLCERGLYADASALVRVLMETATAVAFILQKRSRQRARMYQGHAIAQQLKMLNGWKKTRGLKRLATKALLERTTKALDEWTTQLPSGTNITRHWSGLGGLQQTLTALRGDVMYATLYRFTSSIAHAADTGVHFQADAGSGDLLWEIGPSVEGLAAPAGAAYELLWTIANRIDDRMRLGFGTTLAPHKPTKAMVGQP